MKQPITLSAVLLWLAGCALKLGWSLLRALWHQAFSLLLGVLISWLVAVPADAGWFSRKPDPVVEAASRALQSAAETANETAKIQADQNIRIAEAVAQLSSERAQLAGHLELLGRRAAEDSAWAAALNVLGPVLVIVAVLTVGGLALWLVTRSGPADAQLVDVLLDQATGNGPRWLELGNPPELPRLRDSREPPRLLGAAEHGRDGEPYPDDPDRTHEFDSLTDDNNLDNEEGGLPF